ncbi:immunity 26/phosphotriesterase HocA family protein [Amycolatopsis sp. NPDC089917]|uniref:immunity 26/phosphotriesterase HocA family protein n=1 Tax=Amycolatopsis sp. NPDC089917 TaxID=3155187 RepID=UPI00341D7257
MLPEDSWPNCIQGKVVNVARNLPYSPGDIFAVPLRDHGYALGVVARSDGKGIVLGYFFGPRLESIESLSKVREFEVGSAIKVCRCGDLGLIRENWPVVGRVESWDPSQWNVPDFCRDGGIRVVYDADSLTFSREERLDPSECRLLPQDGLEGAGFVEIKLTRLLGS